MIIQYNQQIVNKTGVSEKNVSFINNSGGTKKHLRNPVEKENT